MGFLAPVDCALATRNSMVDTFGTGMVKVKEHVTHKVYEIFNDDYGRIPSTLIESVPIEYYRPWVTSMFMQRVMLPNYLFTFKGTTNELWASTKEVCTASSRQDPSCGKVDLCMVQTPRMDRIPVHVDAA